MFIMTTPQLSLEALREAKRPEIPEGHFKDLITRCWKDKPEERPRAKSLVEELKADLEAALDTTTQSKSSRLLDSI
jgi:hypothetical protein